jgi:hypothetical protein
LQSYLHILPKQERDAADIDMANFLLAETKMLFDFENLRNGSVRDFKTFDASFDSFGKLIILLEIENDKYKARLEAGRLEMASEILRASVQITKRAQVSIEMLEPKVEGLGKRLQRAKKEFTETKFQMLINVSLYGGSLALPELAIMGTFVKAVVFTAAVMANDRLLGPGSDPWADADVAAGSLIEACPHGVCKALTETVKHYTGLVAALGTLYFDKREQKEAREIAEKLEKELESALRDLNIVTQWLRDFIPKLPALRTALKNLGEARAQAFSKAAATDRDYRDFKEEPR